MAYSEEVEEIRARIRSAFATIYLTLLSIIQGVALAALFAKVDSLLASGRFHAPQFVMALGIFLSIVAVWNQYQMGLNLYAWTANLIDAFIPFTLGLFEFAMISSIGYSASAMLVANGLLLLTGIAAFEQQYFQVRRSVHAAFLQSLNRGFREHDVASCIGAAAVAFGTAAWISWSAPSPSRELMGALVLVALATGHLVREVVQWRVVQRRLSELAA